LEPDYQTQLLLYDFKLREGQSYSRSMDVCSSTGEKSGVHKRAKGPIAPSGGKSRKNTLFVSVFAENIPTYLPTW